MHKTVKNDPHGLRNGDCHFCFLFAHVRAADLPCEELEKNTSGRRLPCAHSNHPFQDKVARRRIGPRAPCTHAPAAADANCGPGVLYATATRRPLQGNPLLRVAPRRTGRVRGWSAAAGTFGRTAGDQMHTAPPVVGKGGSWEANRVRRSLHLRREGVERRVEAGAQGGGAGNDGDSDERGDEAVFDRRRCGIVAQKTVKNGPHCHGGAG